MMKAPMHGIVSQVGQRIVHPAHVPLEAKAQAAQIGWTRDRWPGRGLFGIGLNARLRPISGLIEAAQKRDRPQIFPAAIAVGNPFARLTRIVQIQHRSDRIHAQTVGMIAFQPEQCAAEQKTAHFMAVVVKDVRLPVGMKTLPRVGVLV